MRPASWTILVLAFLMLPAAPASADYPVLEYYVTDNANVLLQVEIYEIEVVCIDLYAQRGVEIAVLVVNTTAPDDIFTYGLKTFEQNGLGQEGEDNGVLLLVSTEDGQWRVEVGYGLEGALTDAKVGALAEEFLVPYLDQGDYYNGIYYMVQALGIVIKENYVNEPPQEEKSPYPISFIPLTAWQLLAVFGVILFLAVITKGKIVTWIPLLLMGRGGRGGGKNWGGGRSGGGGAGGKF